MVAGTIRTKGGRYVAARNGARRHGGSFAHIVPLRPAVAGCVDAARRQVVAVIVRPGEQAVGIIGIERHGRFVLREIGQVLILNHVGPDILRGTGRVAAILWRCVPILVLERGINGHDTGEIEDVIAASN